MTGGATLENHLTLCLKLHIHIVYVLTNSTLGYTLKKTNLGQYYIHNAPISTVPKSKNLDMTWKPSTEMPEQNTRDLYSEVLYGSENQRTITTLNRGAWVA